jgi:hypothetical protein
VSDIIPDTKDAPVYEVFANGQVVGYQVRGMVGTYLTRESAVQFWLAWVQSSGGGLISAKASKEFHRNERKYRTTKGIK